ncbi:hypothetical protein [Nocardioides sp. WS12]|uniref:hypothetical protein n=1 Tax=Nocardioides sp. WS12 TaxID=2486272 RepID=UPI0015FC7E57|nr:hypothetical protein [Nocardioides sp. WS12]
MELDAHGDLVWEAGASITSPDGVSEDGQLLVGIVEDIEGESVVLRVGEGLLLLEVQGVPPLGVLGSEVAVRPSCFEIWPIDL